MWWLGLRVVAEERLSENLEVGCRVGAVLWWSWRIYIDLRSDVSDYLPHSHEARYLAFENGAKVLDMEQGSIGRVISDVGFKEVG